MNLKLEALLGILQGAEASAEYSKANRDKPGKGKVGAVGFNLSESGMPVVTVATYNQRTEEGPLEDENNVTLPDVVHAEMGVILGSPTPSAYIMCTESPCHGCAVHMEAADLSGIFWINDYRCQSGVEFLKGRGFSVREFEVQGRKFKGAIRVNHEQAMAYARDLSQ
ncbi:dCMP deaminase [Delftia phage PhiW-14]|uniref:dCMP deaminase n=1 Tax=Delftia phage PhiW-14 TaxID=665032 RepID=C9DG48_BPW14|nr:dCMP deaminase [Delftia phage PhiW-14]ACV50099.1 dCMP deaminase [Delftia phage PhiW-14]